MPTHRHAYGKLRTKNNTGLKIDIFNEDGDDHIACIELGSAITEALGDSDELWGGASMSEDDRRAWIYNAAVLERHARMIRDYVAMADYELPERKRDSNKMREKYLETLAKQGQEAANLMKEGAEDE